MTAFNVLVAANQPRLTEWLEYVLACSEHAVWPPTAPIAAVVTATESAAPPTKPSRPPPPPPGVATGERTQSIKVRPSMRLEQGNSLSDSDDQLATKPAASSVDMAAVIGGGDNDDDHDDGSEFSLTSSVSVTSVGSSIPTEPRPAPAAVAAVDTFLQVSLGCL